jgi:hypothetical protein
MPVAGICCTGTTSPGDEIYDPGRLRDGDEGAEWNDSPEWVDEFEAASAEENGDVLHEEGGAPKSKRFLRLLAAVSSVIDCALWLLCFDRHCRLAGGGIVDTWLRVPRKMEIDRRLNMWKTRCVG